MFDWLIKKRKGTGAIDDPRTPMERQKDFRFEELGLATAVAWDEKPQDQWRKFPIRDQDGSGSCVAQTIAKMLGIENFNEEGKFIEFSAYDIYDRRSNKPDAGMIGVEGLTFGKEYGATLEQFLPSQNLNEAQMNVPVKRVPSMELVAKIFKGGNFVMLPFNIDAIASVIDRGKGVMMWFKWEIDEWDLPVPKIKYDTPMFLLKNHHSLTGVYRTLYNGQKAIIIDDSWGKNRGFDGQRVITEDWIRTRMTFCAYYEDFSNSEVFNSIPVLKPKFNGTRTLKLADTGTDVAQLQRCLGYLKDDAGYLFPLVQSPTGYFGGITRDSVKRFQKMQQLPVNGEVDRPTLDKLKKIFS